MAADYKPHTPAHSFTVQWNNTHQKYEVVPSHWRPGYTPAHKETPAEALEYAIRIAEIALARTTRQLQQLHEVEYQNV